MSLKLNADALLSDGQGNLNISDNAEVGDSREALFKVDVNFITLGEFDVLEGGSGADVFTLGDTNSPYYLDNGYATITDFNYLEGDEIQVTGSGSNYGIEFQDLSGGLATDTLIFFSGDLIGVVQDTTNVVPTFDFIAA